jgi:hypothetical protein
MDMHKASRLKMGSMTDRNARNKGIKGVAPAKKAQGAGHKHRCNTSTTE